MFFGVFKEKEVIDNNQNVQNSNTSNDLLEDFSSALDNPNKNSIDLLPLTSFQSSYPEKVIYVGEKTAPINNYQTPSPNSQNFNNQYQTNNINMPQPIPNINIGISPQYNNQTPNLNVPNININRVEPSYPNKKETSIQDSWQLIKPRVPNQPLNNNTYNQNIYNNIPQNPNTNNINQFNTMPKNMTNMQPMFNMPQQNITMVPNYNQGIQNPNYNQLSRPFKQNTNTIQKQMPLNNQTMKQDEIKPSVEVQNVETIIEKQNLNPIPIEDIVKPVENIEEKQEKIINNENINYIEPSNIKDQEVIPPIEEETINEIEQNENIIDNVENQTLIPNDNINNIQENSLEKIPEIQEEIKLEENIEPIEQNIKEDEKQEINVEEDGVEKQSINNIQNDVMPITPEIQSVNTNVNEIPNYVEQQTSNQIQIPTPNETSISPLEPQNIIQPQMIVTNIQPTYYQPPSINNSSSTPTDENNSNEISAQNPYNSYINPEIPVYVETPQQPQEEKQEFQIKEQIDVPEGYKVCPKCGQVMRNDYKLCFVCGTHF